MGYRFPDAVKRYSCSTCGAKRSQPCKGSTGKVVPYFHVPRQRKAYKAGLIDRIH